MELDTIKLLPSAARRTKEGYEAKSIQSSAGNCNDTQIWGFSAEDFLDITALP